MYICQGITWADAHSIPWFKTHSDACNAYLPPSIDQGLGLSPMMKPNFC